MLSLLSLVFLALSWFCVRKVYSLDIVEAQRHLVEECNDRSYNASLIFGKKLQKFVTTDPNAIRFGGFGNFVFTVLAAHHQALILGRVMVMNNLLFSSMFEHPDKRQTWDLIPSTEFYSLKKLVHSRPIQCKSIGTIKHALVHDYYGTNGCYGAYLTHPDAKSKFSALVPQLREIEEHGIPYYETMASMLSEWTFSRPTVRWSKIVNEYEVKTLKDCPNEGKYGIDMAVQFRTWHDMDEGGQYGERGGLLFQKCAGEMAIETQKKFSRPICVFVTSDNETTTTLLVNHINSLDSINIKAVWAPPEANHSHWHTDTVVESARWSFDPETLQHIQSLKDWMLLGSAKRALYTFGSSFSFTARLRHGLTAFTTDKVAHLDGGNCTCENVLSTHGFNLRRSK